jgi:ankyrin repeat protein
VMVRDERGATPLHYAAWYGHQDTVEVLLGAGADVNALSGYTTALLYMCPLR